MIRIWCWGIQYDVDDSHDVGDDCEDFDDPLKPCDGNGDDDQEDDNADDVFHLTDCEDCESDDNALVMTTMMLVMSSTWQLPPQKL